MRSAGGVGGMCVSTCASEGGSACVSTCAGEGGGACVGSAAFASFAAFATNAPFGVTFCRLAAASVVDDVVDSFVCT